MDPKLTILFCLIGTIIGLSHCGGEESSKLKRHTNTTSEYLRVDDRTAPEPQQMASLPTSATINADRGETNRG